MIGCSRPPCGVESLSLSSVFHRHFWRPRTHAFSPPGLCDVRCSGVGQNGFLPLTETMNILYFCKWSLAALFSARRALQ